MSNDNASSDNERCSFQRSMLADFMLSVSEHGLYISDPLPDDDDAVDNLILPSGTLSISNFIARFYYLIVTAYCDVNKRNLTRFEVTRLTANDVYRLGYIDFEIWLADLEQNNVFWGVLGKQFGCNMTHHKLCLSMFTFVGPADIPDQLCNDDTVYAIWRYMRFLHSVFGYRIVPSTKAQLHDLEALNREMLKNIALLDNPAARLRRAVKERTRSAATMLRIQSEEHQNGKDTPSDTDVNSDW